MPVPPLASGACPPIETVVVDLGAFTDLWSLRSVVERVTPGRTTVLTLFESPLLVTRSLGPGDYVLVPADGTYKGVQSYIASALP